MPLLFPGCASLGPPEPPSLELPKPPADLRATRKGSKVTLTWSVPTATTDRQTVRSLGPTRICRGLQPVLTECGTAVGDQQPQPVTKPSSAKNAKKKTATSHVDVLPTTSANPSDFITYAVEVLNPEGRGAGLSNQVRVSLAHTLPPPSDFNARVTSQGVVLTWTGASPTGATQGVHYKYRVYRRQEDGQPESLTGELPVDADQVLSLTDSNIEWEKTYEYRAEAITVIDKQDKTEVQIEGDDSAEIKIFAHDVFPPAIPSGLQAAFSGPGQPPFIDLIWAPDSDADLAGYNVYRRTEGEAPARLNSELVKTPAYRDHGVVSGKNYFYSVSAVDIRGNESERSEEASEPVP
jgi:hypothetical protein